jgi:hypothetical protein
MENPYKLLLDRGIIDILDGDTNLNDDENRISMPYLSGPDLCSISTRFGLPVTYSRGSGNPSRWVYLSDLIEHCIEEGKIQTLLSFLFSKHQFKDTLKGFSPEVIEQNYEIIVLCSVGGINGILYFNGYKLLIIDGRFEMRSLDSTVSLSTPCIANLSSSKKDNITYLKSLVNKIQSEIDTSNYDSAVTKSRTLLEESFCYAIEQAGETPNANGKIKDLHNQVKSLYNMHQNVNVDKRINDLLSGLDKIVSAIAEMRNETSDAHGVGSKRIVIKEHHARLIANAAVTVAEFLLSVANRKVE